jgi:hypothetical protein
VAVVTNNVGADLALSIYGVAKLSNDTVGTVIYVG